MNKKGFTLVELIAVITILAILIVITIPAILNTREVATSSIGKQEKQALLEAGQMIGIDIDDYSMLDVKCDNGWIECTLESESGKWNTATITLENLKNYNYFTDNSNHCKSNDDNEAYITITKIDSGYKVEISSNLVCNNY